MQFGAYLFKPEKPSGFNFHLLRVKTEMGVRLQPEPDMHSNIAVFADNAAIREHPDWISQSPLGPARMGNNNFNFFWNVVCATQPQHREEQIQYIQEVDRKSLGIWLNSQYFAEHGHCTCQRCTEKWQKSGLTWVDWRRKEVTEYIAEIRQNTHKPLVMCIQPDPVTSLERYGVHFDDIAKHTDLFNVVMFSKSYATPWYWEMLTRAFKKLLKKPFYISLYVNGPGDNQEETPSAAELLTVSVRSARAETDGILYLFDGKKEAMDFQKAVLQSVELRERLASYGGKPVQEVLDLVKSWEKTLQ